MIVESMKEQSLRSTSRSRPVAATPKASAIASRLRDIVLAAERDDGGAGRDDFDRQRAGWGTASVEEVACVIGAFRRVPLAIGVARALPDRVDAAPHLIISRERGF